MIASASKKISKILFQKNIINEDEQEICQYGLEIILAFVNKKLSHSANKKSEPVLIKK